jgi:16S rRNA (adenine1518-N6/adenine1519-N6)-dimethyltransferase
MLPLKEVIRALRAKKSLGQNFLIDPNILQRIVTAASPLEGRTILEIGPGPGGLSREIIKHPCAAIILVEQDSRCLPYLEELKEHTQANFSLLNADATTLPLHTFGTAPRKVIANLPYNVSVPLLLAWLQHIDAFESLTLMFQKEVADRLMASPNTSVYGRLSVMCQAYAKVEKLFELPPGAFFPPPKVTSTLVQLTPRKLSKEIPWKALETVTKAAFSQRRKMLRSTLKGTVSLSCLETLDLSPTNRAEDLSVQNFIDLSSYWSPLT